MARRKSDSVPLVSDSKNIIPNRRPFPLPDPQRFALHSRRPQAQSWEITWSASLTTNSLSCQKKQLFLFGRRIQDNRSDSRSYPLTAFHRCTLCVYLLHPLLVTVPFQLRRHSALARDLFVPVRHSYKTVYTVRLLTHVLCKPTHFFFHSFIATMSYSLQTSFNSAEKDWAD